MPSARAAALGEGPPANASRVRWCSLDSVGIHAARSAPSTRASASASTDLPGAAVVSSTVSASPDGSLLRETSCQSPPRFPARWRSMMSRNLFFATVSIHVFMLAEPRCSNRCSRSATCSATSVTRSSSSRYSTLVWPWSERWTTSRTRSKWLSLNWPERSGARCTRSD